MTSVTVKVNLSFVPPDSLSKILAAAYMFLVCRSLKALVCLDFIL